MLDLVALYWDHLTTTKMSFLRHVICNLSKKMHWKFNNSLNNCIKSGSKSKSLGIEFKCVKWYWNPSLAYFSRPQLKFLAQYNSAVAFFLHFSRPRARQVYSSCKSSRRWSWKIETLWITVSKQWLRTGRWRLVGYSIDIGKNSSIQCQNNDSWRFFCMKCFLKSLLGGTQP